ncbi:hypothetical protein EOL96_08070 [Candidatus Saccharibacteria bacterium]|nr:hypothetical protein [Candidatus Saccharibacteria bacterium]
MEYVFSWSSFFIGMVAVALSASLVVWYQPIADAMTSGAASYDRVRFWGIVGVLVGFAVMLNLHTLLFSWVLGSLFVL